MSAQSKPAEQELLEKIRSLPPERVTEVEDFVDFLRTRFLRTHDEERNLARAAAKLSEDSFARVWDNPEDAEYDGL
jgi:hypothetical protein